MWISLVWEGGGSPNIVFWTLVRDTLTFFVKKIDCNNNFNRRDRRSNSDETCLQVEKGIQDGEAPHGPPGQHCHIMGSSHIMGSKWCVYLCTHSLVHTHSHLKIHCNSYVNFTQHFQVSYATYYSVTILEQHIKKFRQHMKCIWQHWYVV